MILQKIFTLPLDSDYSWVQILTGINWLVASFVAFSVKRNRPFFWTIFSVFLFFCSLDEHYMIHECFKYGDQLNTKSTVKDLIILFYGIVSFFGAAYFYKKIINSNKQKSILFLMLFLVIVIISNDVFDYSFFELKNAAEECAELLLSALVIYFITLFPNSNFPNAKKIKIILFLIIFHILLGSILRQVLWPYFCPEVLLF